MAVSDPNQGPDLSGARAVDRPPAVVGSHGADSGSARTAEDYVVDHPPLLPRGGAPATTSRVQIFRSEHLSRGVVDKVTVRLALKRGWSGRKLSGKSADRITEALQHLSDRNEIELTKIQPFRGSARWSCGGSPSANARLFGKLGEPLWHLAVTVQLNGARMTRRDLIDRGAYRVEDFPLVPSHDNFIDPSRATVSAENISHLSFGLVTRAVQSIGAHYHEIVSAAWGGALPYEALVAYVDVLEIAVDRSIDEPDLTGYPAARLLFDGIAPFWTIVTGGREQPGNECLELYRARGSNAMKVYVTGTESRHIRGEVRHGRKKSGAPLRFALTDLTAEHFRTTALRDVAPDYEQIVQASAVAVSSDAADGVDAAIQLVLSLHPRYHHPDVLRWALASLIRDGRALARTRRDVTVLRYIRERGLGVWDPRERCTRASKQLIAITRTLLRAP